jgi:hypothetical protein
MAWSGHCIMQSSRPDFDASEYLAMVKEGLNGMVLYAPWLSSLASIAREDPEVLKALQSMYQVTYTGASLNPEDEQWLVNNGVRVAVSFRTAL